MPDYPGYQQSRRGPCKGEARQEHAMNLPDPIRTYFAAEAPQDGAALAAAFAPDAQCAR
jgi:hypothetical protein